MATSSVISSLRELHSSSCSLIRAKFLETLDGSSAIAQRTGLIDDLALRLWREFISEDAEGPSRFVLVAFPCFLVLAIWAGRKPRIVHLIIIALWISWLLVWTSQAVRGFWVG